MFKKCWFISCTTFLWTTAHNKNRSTFSGYAMLYKVKIAEKKDLIVQLEASGLIIKDLFNDLLNEKKALNIRLL